MNKDWFPFFSMLFWFVSKTTALTLLLFGFIALVSLLTVKFAFSSFLFSAVAPMALGYFLLSTDILYDIGTAQQRRRLQ